MFHLLVIWYCLIDESKGLTQAEADNIYRRKETMSWQQQFQQIPETMQKTKCFEVYPCPPAELSNWFDQAPVTDANRKIFVNFTKGHIS